MLSRKDRCLEISNIHGGWCKCPWERCSRSGISVDATEEKFSPRKWPSSVTESCEKEVKGYWSRLPQGVPQQAPVRRRQSKKREMMWGNVIGPKKTLSYRNWYACFLSCHKDLRNFLTNIIAAVFFPGRLSCKYAPGWWHGLGTRWWNFDCNTPGKRCWHLRKVKYTGLEVIYKVGLNSLNNCHHHDN